MSLIMYGKPLADDIAKNIKSRLEEKGLKPTLCIIGLDDKKWLQYSNSLVKSCENYGFSSKEQIFDEDVSFDEFRDFVVNASKDSKIDGIILQQPLPEKLRGVVNFVDVDKDVDCLNPMSVANLYLGKDGYRPATALAVVRLLEYYGFSLQGKNMVIVGRGNAVGKPLALIALSKNATITVCHTKTVDLPSICKRADILVSACGVPGIIKNNYVSDDAVVCDVGLSFVDGKTCGDVDSDVYDLCKAISPVPKGIGPVTRAVLFEQLANKILNK